MSEWKPSNMVPKSSGLYIGVVIPDDGPDYPPYVTLIYFYKNSWSHYDLVGDEPYPLANGETISHWMPLPEPPK